MQVYLIQEEVKHKVWLSEPDHKVGHFCEKCLSMSSFSQGFLLILWYSNGWDAPITSSLLSVFSSPIVNQHPSARALGHPWLACHPTPPNSQQPSHPSREVLTMLQDTHSHFAVIFASYLHCLVTCWHELAIRERLPGHDHEPQGIQQGCGGTGLGVCLSRDWFYERSGHIFTVRWSLLAHPCSLACAGFG